jgi:hypothetical protein
MIKKSILLTILVLALPFVAFAGSSVDFTNSGGNLTGTSSGLTLAGSTLVAVDGLGGGLITGNNLGAVSFSTGALSSGTLQMGGTFASGGAFSITGNGTDGVPTGVIFSGSFQRAGELDAGYARQRYPQLHANRFVIGRVVHRGHREWRNGTVDHQHG